MSRGSFKIEYEGGMASLYIVNPEARNAISEQMMLALPNIIDQIEASKCTTILISGQDGKAFCSGGDLRDVRHSLIAPGKGEEMSLHMAKCLNRIQNMDAVVVAAVEGAALGGGAEILTACDYVVASSRARIGFVHASLGVSPGWGGGALGVRPTN